MNERIKPSTRNCVKDLPLRDKVLYYIGMLRIDRVYLLDSREWRFLLQYRKWHPLTILLFLFISVIMLGNVTLNCISVFVETAKKNVIDARKYIKELYNYKTIT